MLKISLIRPGAEVSTTSRSARYTASRIECVTKTVVLCSTRWMRESSSCITSRVCASRAPNGSSMSTMDGLLASARAIATRCFIPPESCTGNFVECSRSPTMSRYRAAISRHRAASTPARRGPNSTFWATVSQGKSTYSWKTTPRSGPGPVIGVASTSTRPRVGGRKPATMLSSVDFPQPDGPSRHRSSPAWTSRLMSTSAGVGRPGRTPCGRPRPERAPRRHPPGSSRGRTLPPEPATAEADDESVARVAEEPQHNRGAEHLVHEEEVPPVVDEVAEPLFGADELGDDDDEERERHAETDPGQDLRQRRRQHDAEEERRAPGAQAGGGAEQQRVHLPDRVDRREEHRKERRVGDERDLRRLADPHPDDEERQHRQRRDRPQDLDDRLEQVADHGEVPSRQPEGERQEGARREADDDALDRGGDVAPELAGHGELRHLSQDAPRAGEEDRIEEVPEHDESRRETPHEEEGDDRIHPDKAFIADRTEGLRAGGPSAQTLVAELKKTFTVDDIYRRARRVMELAVRHGCTTMRAHVEVDAYVELRGVEALRRLQAELAGVLDLRLIAFAQEGIFRDGVTRDLLREALKAGLAVLAGCPSMDRDQPRHIDWFFDTAQDFGVPLDFHADSADDPAMLTSDYIAEQTIIRGMQGRVTVGHLGTLDSIAEIGRAHV